MDALKEENREGRGVVTVSNHISVLDDPLMWGVMPMNTFFSFKNTRWTLGARDILFTNPVFSAFFRNGKVIDTARGDGIAQAAVDFTIERLDEGEWVHIFPQGYIRQDQLVPPLDRLKWGIGRILTEVKSVPTIVPMWIKGFEKVMPEHRGFPRFVPRKGAEIEVHFGNPASLRADIISLRKQWEHKCPVARKSVNLDEPALCELRERLTSRVQKEMESLGRCVT